MTFYHFANCLAVAYLPYHLTYKLSLAEYGAFWKCVQAGFVYALTQLVKMLIFATFFPLPTGGLDQELKTSYHNAGNGPLTLEFFKASMDLIDLIGVFLTLARIPGRGYTKILTVGIGWATAELVLSRLLSLWVGAKGIEFSWRYIQESLDANISLVQHLTVTALVWVWTRHNLKASLLPLVSCLLVLSIYKPLIVEATLGYFTLDPWSSLILNAVLAVVVGIVTLRVYSTVSTA